VLDSKTLSTAAEIADEVQIFSHLNLGICYKSCISMPKTVFPKMTLSAAAYLADAVFVSHIIVQNCCRSSKIGKDPELVLKILGFQHIDA